jgi:CRP-like cAMP-binding protein
MLGRPLVLLPTYGTRAVSQTRVSSNRILAALQREDLALLEPYLERMDLPLRKYLETRNKQIELVYFIESGIASVVANGGNHSSIEVGLVGCEGMTGIALLLGADRAPHAIYMQVAGAGFTIPAGALRDAMQQSASLQRTLLRYAHAFFIQTTYTALINGRSKVEERLARWLLMAHDRVKGNELPLTHEFLSIMLGVRRPGVTNALRTLQDAGLVDRRRGMIRIVDREGLKKASNGAYGPPEAEFQKLFSGKP